MTLRLGNILPGHTATIKMTMIEPLEIVAAGGDGGAEFAIDANLFGFGVDGGVGVGDDGLGVDAGINLGPLGRIGADANLDADKDGISAGVGADATNLLSADADAAVNFKFLETNTETSDRV